MSITLNCLVIIGNFLNTTEIGSEFSIDIEKVSLSLHKTTALTDVVMICYFGVSQATLVCPVRSVYFLSASVLSHHKLVSLFSFNNSSLSLRWPVFFLAERNVKQVRVS